MPPEDASETPPCSPIPLPPSPAAAPPAAPAAPPAPPGSSVVKRHGGDHAPTNSSCCCFFGDPEVATDTGSDGGTLTAATRMV